MSFHLLGTNGFHVKAKKKKNKKGAKDLPFGALVVVGTSNDEVENFALSFGRQRACRA